MPLKILTHLPKIPGITPKTRRFLKVKALYYLLKHDERRVIPRYLFHFRYLFRLLAAYAMPKALLRRGDFFFYGIETFEEFEKLLLNLDTVIVVGFSYCHKPFECPSGRFSSECQNDLKNSVCNQCFIGQMKRALPTSERVVPLLIPTIHYIGEEMCKLVTQYPQKKIVFLITACELTLTMFADFGRMIGIRGIGVRLDGRICNTMKAFDLSEKGIKPGLTVVLPETALQMLRWASLIRT